MTEMQWGSEDIYRNQIMPSTVAQSYYQTISQEAIKNIRWIILMNDSLEFLQTTIKSDSNYLKKTSRA